MRSLYLLLFISVLSVFYYSCVETNAQQAVQHTTANRYAFCNAYDSKQSVQSRIAVPEGFTRVPVTPGSFADWLRHLPLKPGKPDVHLYNGKLKDNQNVHYAVDDIDAGTTDLQQCADAVIRMRAEYLYSIGDYAHLHFNFTSGQSIGFEKWAQGYRPQVKGNNVNWVKNAPPSSDYASFRSYLNTIFMYAGTSSLSKELQPVASLNDIQIGDVFITPGFPGHAVLVIDVCGNKTRDEKLFLIQQSYMPAQEIHILKNFTNVSLSPWYSTNFAGNLETPQWTFTKSQLMRFAPL